MPDEFVVVRQQAITWAGVDKDRRRHVASLSYNELKLTLPVK